MAEWMGVGVQAGEEVRSTAPAPPAAIQEANDS